VVVSGALEDAATITDRLRSAVTAPMLYQGHGLRIGVSVGHAAAAALDDPTSDALLAAADADMYREKNQAAAVTSPV
jgi:GGDEF domain-containing protein